MPRAIVIRAPGGPEVLRPEEVTVGLPGAGEIRLRQTAVGVNFHDIYVRSGLYRTLDLPGVPGLEAAAVVEEVGPGVSGFSPGDRVGYVTKRYGGYAAERVLPAERAVRLPDALDDATVAGLLLKGLTVDMLVRKVHAVRPGDTVLVHAAAGGVGQLLCQWAVHLGATVIGTAGSTEKAAIARACGCAHVILYREQDFVAAVREITGGHGVQAAYDAVGKDTFLGSLDCLAVRGQLVNFGAASGPVEPFVVARLAARSNSVSRPMLFDFIADRAELEEAAAALFRALADGAIRPPSLREFPLDDAAGAHRALEGRQTTGALVLRV